MFEKSDESFETVVDLVRERTQAGGDRRAFTYLADGESAEINLSFADFDRKIRAVAAQLQQMAKPGDRAVLAYPNGVDALIGFLGAIYAGMVAVPGRPPRPNQPPSDLLAVIADTQASLLLTSTPGLPAIKPALERVPTCKGVGTDAVSDTLADSWKPPALRGDDLVVLQYTSGSTKAPRGIKICHRQMLTYVSTPTVIRPAPKGECTFVHWLPLASSFGLFYDALLPLFECEQSVIMSPLDFTVKPVRWLRAISHYHGAVSAAPNFAFQLCVDCIPLDECTGLKLDSWGVVATAGEPIRAASLAAFAQKFAAFGMRSDKFYCMFAQTEGLNITSRHGPVVSVALERGALARNEVVEVAPDKRGAQNFVSNGPPFEGETVLIVDPETLVERGPNQVGEIWVQSPTVNAGYWNRPEETQAVFEAHLANGAGPFLRSGDLGFMKDGELYVTGRIKDVIIVHGQNIYAQDIEQTAEKSHPSLQPAASAAVSMTLNDEEHLGIVLEVRAGAAKVDTEEITRAVRRAIADEYQLPVHTVALVAANTIPRTPQGKVQRFVVRDSLLKELQA